MNNAISKETVIDVLDAVDGIIAEANEDGTRCELPENNDEFAELISNYMGDDTDGR